MTADGSCWPERPCISPSIVNGSRLCGVTAFGGVGSTSGFQISGAAIGIAASALLG